MENEYNDNDSRVVESSNEDMDVFCSNSDVLESNGSVLPVRESENIVVKQHNENEEFELSAEEDFRINRIGNKRQAITDSDFKDLDKISPSVNIAEVSKKNSQCNEHTISETDLENHPVSQMAVEIKKKSKCWAILDSDSDVAEEESTYGPESDSHEVSKSYESLVYTTDYKGKIVPEYSVHKKSRWTALCDSDSDDDNQETEIVNDNNEHALGDEIMNPTTYKKKSRCTTSEKTSNVKMTGKEAAKQRREIQSESQRMVREMNVSLPYHRPKSFTLREFLSRKTKISTAIPVPAGISPSVAIKLSRQQLEIISKKLKQHEREVKEFYKSESESGEEDLNDEDYVPSGMDKTTGTIETSHSSAKSVNDSEKTCTEENKNYEMAEDSGVDTQEAVEESSTDVNDKPAETNYISIEIIQKKSQLYDSEMDVNNSLVKTDINDEITQEPPNKSEGICIIDDTETTRENQISDDHGESSEKSSTIVDQHSMEYEFNLDNIDQNSEKSLDNKIGSIEIDLTTNNHNGDEKIIATENQISDDHGESSEKSSTIVDQHSMEYEFNLDNIDQNSEKSPDNKIGSIEIDLTTNNHNGDEKIIATATNNGEKNILQLVGNDTEHHDSIELFVDSTMNQPKSFECSNLDRDKENFVKFENHVQIEKPKLSKLDLLREKLANIKPRLNGGENEIIDLNTKIARPNEVTKLMQRFVQHTTKINSHKSRVKLNIVSVESGEIFKETLDMNVGDDDLVEIEEKPGAKLQKLRGELQNRMLEQRMKIWQKKNAELTSADKDTDGGEKSACEAEDIILDDDEEEEMSESSEEENEEEDEQKDEYQAKSVIFNDEADESDREDSEGDCIETDDGDDEQEIDEEAKCEVLKDEESKSSEGKPAQKTLKRILQGFTEDSDEDDQFDLTSQNYVPKAIENLNQNIEAEVTQDDDYMPSHQPQNVKTPVRRPAVSQSTSEYDFLTPVSYITGLNNLNSASKSKNFGVVSPFRMPNVPSPLKEANWQANLQKKLFTHSEITNSQAEAIAELCSDNVYFSQEPVNKNTNQELCPSPVNTQDILNICSGEFTDNSQEVLSTAPPTSQDLLNICSGEFTGVSQVTSDEALQTPLETHTFNPTKEVKSLGADEGLIISQLLDEEMEKFKKDFETQLKNNSQRRIIEEFEEFATSGGVIDSDDDENEGLEVKKKVNQRKLIFSDESSDDEEEKEEVIDLHDEINEDDNDADNIGYDSEENEVEYISDKGKLTDFFDKEAELSESEWESADEDEKDLDTMEFEQGDIEKFDEKKIRSDLEKIHMRRMLDDDTREVKLLQELLLEDGELHGTGRERQFRWKNIDYVDDTEGGNKEDNDTCYLDEEESEEQWRKKRHEIEMFLKEKHLKSSTSDEFDLLSDSQSQFLKTGHKVIQNSSQASVPDSKPTDKSNSPDTKRTFSFMNKRGSFLSRNDQVLQRLADYNKQTNIAVNSAKNTRNFLFQTVNVAETAVTNGDKKRKAIGDTPKVIKKLRLSDNMSPAVGRKKKIDQPSAKAKLFGQ